VTQQFGLLEERIYALADVHKIGLELHNFFGQTVHKTAASPEARSTCFDFASSSRLFQNLVGISFLQNRRFIPSRVHILISIEFLSLLEAGGCSFCLSLLAFL
jgi:hypothetical protein